MSSPPSMNGTRKAPANCSTVKQTPRWQNWWDHLSTHERVGCGITFMLSVFAVLLFLAVQWHDSAAALSYFSNAVAVIAGGGWVLYQYGVKRLGESGLLIDIAIMSSTYSAHERRHLVSLEVRLKNSGNCRLTARSRALCLNEIAEFEDTVKFPGDIQLRKLRSGLPDGNVSYWKHKNFEYVGKNKALLDEYTKRDGEDWVTEFFMEPGEEYTLARSYVLTEGHYMVKVVFLGDRNPLEYWSRIKAFTVPATRPGQQVT